MHQPLTHWLQASPCSLPGPEHPYVIGEIEEKELKTSFSYKEICGLTWLTWGPSHTTWCSLWIGAPSVPPAPDWSCSPPCPCWPPPTAHSHRIYGNAMCLLKAIWGHHVFLVTCHTVYEYPSRTFLPKTSKRPSLPLGTACMLALCLFI